MTSIRLRASERQPQHQNFELQSSVLKSDVRNHHTYNHEAHPCNCGLRQLGRGVSESKLEPPLATMIQR